jgi:hypothetical protein
MIGKKRDGRSSLNSLFETRSFILNLFGINNIFEHSQIDSGANPGVDIQGGSGNQVDDVQFEVAGEAVNVAPGANSDVPAPIALHFVNFDGVRMTAGFNGVAGQSYEIKVWSVVTTYDPVTQLFDQTYIPLNVSFSVTASNGGFVDIDHSFLGTEAFAVLDQKYLVATATLISGGMRSTSEMSEPAVVPRAPYDFDEDGRTDAAVVRQGTSSDPSYWYIMGSRSGGFLAEQFGTGQDLITPGYFNGDRAANFSVFRPTNGTWYISRPGGSAATNFQSFPFGALGDIPIQNFDYDGDRRADAAVFRPADATWYIRGSLGGYSYGRQFGLATDRLVPADYNGDGRGDIAVYRDGVWYYIECPVCSTKVSFFGLPGDVPVPGDFDGDGLADKAVFRPSDGNWYVMGTMKGFQAVHWGQSGDVPLNVDWDGDGKNDYAIWRQSTGDWWISLSRNNQPIGFHFGQNGDDPVPAFRIRQAF